LTTTESEAEDTTFTQNETGSTNGLSDAGFRLGLVPVCAKPQAEQTAEKITCFVILSEAKNLSSI
jgi:hypothetical protein